MTKEEKIHVLEKIKRNQRFDETIAEWIARKVGGDRVDIEKLTQEVRTRVNSRMISEITDEWEKK